MEDSNTVAEAIAQKMSNQDRRQEIDMCLQYLEEDQEWLTGEVRGMKRRLNLVTH